MRPRWLIVALFFVFTWLYGCTSGDLPSAPNPGGTRTVSPSATATDSWEDDWP